MPNRPHHRNYRADLCSVMWRLTCGELANPAPSVCVRASKFSVDLKNDARSLTTRYASRTDSAAVKHGSGRRHACRNRQYCELRHACRQPTQWYGDGSFHARMVSAQCACGNSSAWRNDTAATAVTHCAVARTDSHDAIVFHRRFHRSAQFLSLAAGLSLPYAQIWRADLPWRAGLALISRYQARR